MHAYDNYPHNNSAGLTSNRLRVHVNGLVLLTLQQTEFNRHTSLQFDRQARQLYGTNDAIHSSTGISRVNLKSASFFLFSFFPLLLFTLRFICVHVCLVFVSVPIQIPISASITSFNPFTAMFSLSSLKTTNEIAKFEIIKGFFCT